MNLFNPKERKRRKKLRRFRQAFLRITADGTYSPERQQKLYHWCNIADLDWEEARRFVRPEAQALLHRHVGAITRQRPLTDEDIANIQRLQRRLGLEATSNAPTTPLASLSSSSSSWQLTALLILLVIALITGVSLLAWQLMPRNNQGRASFIAPTQTSMPPTLPPASPTTQRPPTARPLLVPTVPPTAVAEPPQPLAIVTPTATLSPTVPPPVPTGTNAPTTTPVPTGTDAPTTTPVPTATLAPATTPAPLATGAENVITVDTIRGTVITFENLGDRFTIDNRAYLTEYGVFVRLTFEAENIGKTVSSLAIRQMMDSQERVFPPYNEIFVKDYCRGSLTLAPNLPAKCMMVYEVPPDAEEFTVTFSSGGSEQVLLLGTPES